MNKLFHPILASVFPILFFYSFNRNQLNLNIIVQPLLLSLFVFIILWVLISLILRSWPKGSLLTTLYVIWFFSYGHLSNLFNKIYIPIGSVVLGPDKFLFPVWIILLVVGTVLIIKSHKSLEKWNGFLTIFITGLVVIQIINILPAVSKFSSPKTKPGQSQNQKSDTPDIYFIILDGYAREDILKNVFSYDNSNFIYRLRNMNFKVKDDARSNYSQTFFSLSSTLNMKHVNYLTAEIGKDSQDVSIPFKMVGENEVAKILKQKGYKVINLASGWGPTDKLTSADLNYDEGKLFQIFGKKININEFYIVFLQTTSLSPFIKNVLADQARAKVLYAFNKLGEVPYLKGSKFVIAHFNVPHPPYLFDQQGDPVPDQLLELAGESFGDRKNYLNQLTFVNQEITKTLTKIISNSSQPPIIILQSDHGPASIMGHPYKWIRPAPSDGVKERMSILSAFYLPKAVDQKFIPTTPVNDFRFIFNQYFDSNYEMLPETSYFSDYNSIYEFFEIKQ